MKKMYNIEKGGIDMEYGYEFLAGGLIALLAISIVVFFITSLVIKEEFEFIDYISVTGMIFAFQLLIFLILAVVLSLFDYQSLQNDILLLVISFFLSYASLSYLSAYWTLRNTIMFAKTRTIVSLIYAFIFATIFTLFGGIL